MMKNQYRIGGPMTSISFRESFGTISLSPRDVTLFLLFVVLFIPAVIYNQHSASRMLFGIQSLMWQVEFYRNGSIVLRLDPNFLLIWFYLKYLLVFQFYRYYRRFTTRKRVLIFALLSELQMVIMVDIPRLVDVILGSYSWTATNWFFPLPITLVACLIFMALIPRPESEPMWIGDTEDESWWETRVNELDSNEV